MASTARADGAADAARAGAAAEAHLFDGRKLVAEGKILDGCQELSVGHRLVPTAATALEVGDCFEKAGRPASARFAYDEARSLARRGADEAERRMKMLEERQPKLILEAPGGVPAGTVIRIDGLPIDPAATGMPLPIATGPHLVEVSRGGSTWSARVEVEATGAVRVPLPGSPVAKPPAPAVPMGALPPNPRIVVAPKPAPEVTEEETEAPAKPAAGPVAKPAPPAPRINWEAHRVSGVVIGSVGVVALIAGAAFGVEALVEKGASNGVGNCNAADYCTAKGLALRNDAMHAGVISTATLFAGAAATASGVALFFTAPAPFDRVPVTVGISAGPGSAHVTGRW